MDDPGSERALPPECNRALRGEFTLSRVVRSCKSGKQGRLLAPFLGRSKLVLAEAVVKCIYKERRELVEAAAVSAASLQLALISQAASFPAVLTLIPMKCRSRIQQVLASACPQLPSAAVSTQQGPRDTRSHSIRAGWAPHDTTDAVAHPTLPLCVF